jgi:hypothetical protein
MMSSTSRPTATFLENMVPGVRRTLMHSSRTPGLMTRRTEKKEEGYRGWGMSTTVGVILIDL